MFGFYHIPLFCKHILTDFEIISTIRVKLTAFSYKNSLLYQRSVYLICLFHLHTFSSIYNSNIQSCYCNLHLCACLFIRYYFLFLFVLSIPIKSCFQYFAWSILFIYSIMFFLQYIFLVIEAVAVIRAYSTKVCFEKTADIKFSVNLRS